MMKADVRRRFRIPSTFDHQHSALHALAFFFLLSLAWLWPVPARLFSRIPHDPGDPVLNTWILWWNTQALPFTERWWNAPVFFPSPGALALSEHLFGIAVFTSPLQLAGANPVGAYNVALILSSWLSGFFAFLLGRRLTGSTLAGAVAGTAFAFAPYRVGQLSHLQVLTAQWMPLALYSMHAYISDRRTRWLALFAVAWLLQALSNGYYLLFFPVFIALWLAWFIRWRSEPRPGFALALTFAVASLALVPSLLEYREVHEGMGLARQRAEMVLFSAEPGSLLRMPHMLRFWPDLRPRTQEDFLFPGVTAVLLVLVGLAAVTRRGRIRAALRDRSPLLFYPVATVLMWWLAFGPAPDEQPLQGIVKPYTWLTVLPGFSGLRAPSRFAMLACLALSVAAALAFRRIAPSRPGARAALTALVFAGLFIDGWPDPIPLHPLPGRILLPEARDAIVLELPLDETAVGTAAMYRQIDHGRPLLGGYSGHFPPHHRILTSALRREDPSAILQFAAGRPLIIFVNHHYDPGGELLQFVRGLPGIVEEGGSEAGSAFVLPARPRPRVGAVGPALQPAGMTHEAREHTIVDLGVPQIVRAVGFNVRWHFEELAPRMQVETSRDGENWTSVWLDWTGGLAVAAAIEDQRAVPVRIALPDVRARYLRIHPVPAWMVRELTVFGPH
jgi:hypothetical protein